MALTYSIIIPNYNGAKFLPGCLDSIAAQTLAPLETIVVDDASTDNSVRLLGEEYSWVKVIARKKNGLFAAAVNDGIDAAQAEIIVLFNNDAEAEPNWLAAIDHTLREQPEIDAVASKIMLYDQPGFLHTAGDYYRANGVPGNRGAWQEDKGQYDRAEEVFGACAAAAAYRRAALDEVRSDHPDGKVLDESLTMYLEDVDLNLRLRLRGRRTLYQPAALVRHRLSATGGGTRSSYQCGRNFIVVAFKDLPSEILRSNLCSILRSQLGYTLFSLRHLRLATERARLKGQWDGLRALPATLRQRKQVQAHRQVSTAYFVNLLNLRVR
ncbi:MAG: glycosyltransferase [Chloroflexi bacterium]|nr:glycosyltransferase [Chloroflexota bacterium]